MAASNDPTQWFTEDEVEDPEYDAGSVDLTRDDSSGDSSGDDNGDTPNESSEDEDGTDTDPECDVEPLEVAAAVRGAMEQPPGERKVVLKGKTYTLAQQGQSKKPLIPVFRGNVPKECEQLNELFRMTGGKKYWRPVISGSSVDFSAVSVKAIRGVVAAMLKEMPDDTRDVRVFCQEYTTEDVFKHLIGITEKKPATEPPKAETEKTAEPAKPATEPPKAEPPKAEPEKTAEEPTSEKEATPPKKKAPKRKAPAGEPKTAKKKRQAPGQTTLDASVVVRDKPAPKPKQPAVPAEAPAEAPAQPSAAYAARLQVSSIIRAKLGEITTLLDFLEKNEKTRAAERELGL